MHQNQLSHGMENFLKAVCIFQVHRALVRSLTGPLPVPYSLGQTLGLQFRATLRKCIKRLPTANWRCSRYWSHWSISSLQHIWLWRQNKCWSIQKSSKRQKIFNCSEFTIYKVCNLSLCVPGRSSFLSSGLVEPKISDFWLKHFSNQKRTGNYQVWNVNYWNFYPNYVVFQSKLGTYQTDLNDENSFLLIAENQSTSDIRKLPLLTTLMLVTDFGDRNVGENIRHQHLVTSMTVTLKHPRVLSSTIFDTYDR